MGTMIIVSYWHLDEFIKSICCTGRLLFGVQPYNIFACNLHGKYYIHCDKIVSALDPVMGS